MSFELRPYVDSDFTTVAALQARYETFWFGHPEHDEDEVREELTNATRAAVVTSEDAIAAVVWADPPRVALHSEPGTDPVQLVPLLLDWIGDQPGHIDVPSRDVALCAALSTHGWQHTRSAFELIRAVDAEWAPAAPQWPAEIEVVEFGAVDPAEMHHLIYVDAAWAGVAGHVERGFEQWRGMFLGDKELPEQQVLARRDGRLVGVSLGRTFSDNVGWVSQLAVARDQRGLGLGRALLLESFQRRIAAGAAAVGLSVQAENDKAIALYLGVGLTIDREWQVWQAADG